MNRRITAAVVGGIAAVASAGTALALPSHATATSGTLKFTAVQTAQRNFHNGNFVGGDVVMSGGHRIGTDTIDCVPSSSGKTADCDFAASFRQGQLRGTFTLDLTDGSLAGKVTGGTRHFTDA